MIRNKRTWVLAALGTCFAAANADIVILPGPGDIQGDENVLFNEQGLIDTGPLVEGITNQSDLIVNFFDAFEDLTTLSGNQVEAVDGGFTDLSIALDGVPNTFTSLILNLNAVEDGSVDFTVEQAVGDPFMGTFDIDGAGANFFRIIALNGQLITEVTLHTTVDLEDVSQVRIGGAVPEPGTFLALGVGLAALLARRRRR
ncbi:MAG: PEP-CTERM sorting domain-containing protein [Fimbriimonadales bacterium]